MTTGLTYSVALDGVSGRVVTVEADVSNGVPGWSLSGLPDPCVAEARDRCRAAVINSKQQWPDRRITVAMYPADVRKVGSHYDLAIAVALLVAGGAIDANRLRSTALFGELSLDGRLRPIPGVLPAVLAAREAGLGRVMVPEPNQAEAALVDALEVTAVKSLRECVAILRGEEPPSEPDYLPLHMEPSSTARRSFGESTDLADVKGQAVARWCVEVAAAGGHHLFLEGPPGAGKTMLAERLPALLPSLNLRESIEVSKIHSVAGLLSRFEPLIERPPFLAPNHTDTVASVIGGGSRVIRPGAISLAHLGVLFLDEAPEFKPTVHDALRQPLESGEISIRRADAAARFPANFQLVLAANPCPCGNHEVGEDICRCEPVKVRRYQQRISGPVRDRLDIHHRLQSVTTVEMYAEVDPAATTAAVAARVHVARERQRARFDGLPWLTNASVPGVEFLRRCPLSTEAARPLEGAVRKGRITQRGAVRVVRMAWTIADLTGADRPSTPYVEQALELRGSATSHSFTPLRVA